MGKKPPDDEYKCIKVRLDKLLYMESYKDRNLLQVINSAVIRTNKIVIKTYMLLRLWVLDKYHKKQDIPIIDEHLIAIAFKTFIDTKGIRSVGNDNKKQLDEFKTYYNEMLFGKLEDGSALTNILIYYSRTMETAITNNIINNFTSYLNRYINSYFTKKYEKEILNKEYKKTLFSELKILKNDILNNTSNCDIKYHPWLNSERVKLIPILDANEGIYADLHIYPQKYLKYMIYMTGELEIMEKKQFQFFPLQLNTIPNSIQIDNNNLIALLETNPTSKQKTLQTTLWRLLFKHKYLQDMKGYTFDNCIITDGYSVSVRYIETTNALKKKEERIKNMKNANNIRNAKLKGHTKEEKQIIKQQINDEKQIKETKHKQDLKNKITETIKKNKEDVNEKAKNKKHAKNNNNNNKDKVFKKEIIIDKKEIPYIDDVDRTKLQGKHIFIDPGKRTLLNMVDDENNYFRYTNRQYLEETKRLKYSKKIKKIKDNLNITSSEAILSDFNSKSIDIIKFTAFITNKTATNLLVMDKYIDNRFRKYKWYAYINKKRTEDNLLNKIEKHYSKEHKIIIGDWSIGKQMSNYISTPNIRLKRKLRTRFEVYNIDEFRTSCINYKTENICDNLNLWFNDKKREMHSILTFTMENNRLGCINRDKNGCNNIKKLFNCYLQSKPIPLVYSRSHKLIKNPPTANCRLSNDVDNPLNRVVWAPK